MVFQFIGYADCCFVLILCGTGSLNIAGTSMNATTRDELDIQLGIA
jgi:hypothetical protein